MDFGIAIVLIVGFLAVVLLLEGGYLMWSDYKGPEAQRLERRLRALSAGAHGTQAASLLKKRALEDANAFQRVLLMLPRVSVLDKLIQQSGTTMTLPRLLSLMAMSFAAVFLGALVFRAPFALALVAGAAVAAVAPLTLLVRRNRRLAQLDRQLPDAVELIARAMRAGHAFPSALQMAGEELPEPIGSEFRLAFDEVNFGVQMQDALLNLATRVPSDDLRFFVIAVMLQRETGGNLAEILDNISKLIRERFKLLGTIRVLSAEGRMSAWILTLLPFGTALMISIVNPEFLSLLWRDPAGLRIVGVALMLMVMGVLWMWRLIKIRV